QGNICADRPYDGGHHAIQHQQRLWHTARRDAGRAAYNRASSFFSERNAGTGNRRYAGGRRDAPGVCAPLPPLTRHRLVTVTVAVADLVASATLTAVTVTLPVDG